MNCIIEGTYWEALTFLNSAEQKSLIAETLLALISTSILGKFALEAFRNPCSMTVSNRFTQNKYKSQTKLKRRF